MSEAIQPTEFGDVEARRRALTDFESTLLVEAGAGTGKTSLLAARLTLLLASGAPPAEIAAITFTEAAASELADRVRSYVSDLLEGEVPKPLRDVLPRGVSLSQRKALEEAAAHLDALTTATIHGFCRILLAGYAVEADLDPGAQVMDEGATELVYDRIFDAWLTRSLSGGASDENPVVLLAREDPRGVVKLLRKIARFRRRQRTAQAIPVDLAARPDLDFQEALKELKVWCAAAPPVTGVSQIVDELETYAGHFENGFAGSPRFQDLWRLAHPPSSSRRVYDDLELRRPRAPRSWGKEVGAEVGERLEKEYLAAFDRFDAAYRHLLGAVSGAIISGLTGELDEVLTDYDAYKRSAAVMDYDDLLYRAQALLKGHPAVRQALSDRFRRILVDEFQDTDPIQCDIIFRLAGAADAGRWEDVPQRPGALFLVGDPKQSLFSFRGADIRIYKAAKAVVERAFPGNILNVTANFRTIEDILTYVNTCFAAPLNAPGQPGYVALEATRKTPRHSLPPAVKLSVSLDAKANMSAVRETEAAAVAEVCAQLVGGLELKEGDGTVRRVRPGDIALLAPAGTDLWRYERALQQQQLPYASTAGKGYFRRQEVQDLVAITRVLADANDTLALGALLRGPLVGFTDETLLDFTAALPRDSGDPAPRLSLRTPIDQIADPALREILSTLDALRRQARRTTPSQLLIEAVERLKVRAVLTRRDARRASAANANVDLFLQRAAGYGVRGLKRFAQDLTEAWVSQENAAEGQVDSEGEAIEIVSIHSAKGLEWPIVILINTASEIRPSDQIIRCARDDTLHWTVGKVSSPGLQAAMRDELDDQARERARLLYVGCTRARDLLIIPRIPSASADAYSSAADLAFGSLMELDLTGVAGETLRPAAGAVNAQDPQRFQEEADRIAEMSRPIDWIRPSDHDGDQVQFTEVTEEDMQETGETPDVEGAGRLRGLVLHKLFEEILGEGLEETPTALTRRARELIDQLSGLAIDEILPDPAEVANTTVATLRLPEIAELRPSLVPEASVFAMIARGKEARPLTGRADAIALCDGEITTVIDWKSDVAPSDQRRLDYERQLRLYLAATHAPRGALVYATLGQVRWVEPFSGQDQ